MEFEFGSLRKSSGLGQRGIVLYIGQIRYYANYEKNRDGKYWSKSHFRWNQFPHNGPDFYLNWGQYMLWID